MIKIGISSCLLGNAVRYDGGHKRIDAVVIPLLKEFELLAICPEVECGLTVPREPMRLVRGPEGALLVTIETNIDHALRMNEWISRRLRELEASGIGGFVLKARSPSCGIGDAEIVDAAGRSCGTGSGLFASAVRERFPALPVRNEEDLREGGAIRSFIEAVTTGRGELLSAQGNGIITFNQLKQEKEIMEDRVQKIIAAAGITSRRQAEQLILEGRVRVNGAVVTELGTKADPERDHIKVDGKLINPVQPRAYIMLNKPLGYVTTMADPEGRPVVSDLLQGLRTRVYPVGRLDYHTEGLLLLTNDGEFAHLITHPSHELPKTYLVKVKGVLDDRNVEQLERGMFLRDGKTAPATVRRLRKEEANSWVEITIHEGRKRQVRRMIDHTGHSVIKLKRVRIGSLGLGDLPTGAFRHLTPEEVAGLKQAAQQEQQGGWSAAQNEPRPRRPAARQEQQQPPLKERAPEQGQKDFDTWAAETARRRKQEREGKKRAAAPARYDRRDPSASAGERKHGSGGRRKGAYVRGPGKDRDRSAGGPSFGRKPVPGGRDRGPYSRGPKQDRDRGAGGPSFGRKPIPGDRDRGSYARGPGQGRDREGQRPAWGKRPGPGGQTRTRHQAGQDRTSARTGQRPAWGKRQGPAGQPRTGQGPRRPGTSRGGKGRGRKA